MSRPGIGAWRIQAKRIGARVGLAAWLLGMLAIGSSLLARHSILPIRMRGVLDTSASPTWRAMWDRDANSDVLLK
jgi:hypothetical protein